MYQWNNSRINLYIKKSNKSTNNYIKKFERYTFISICFFLRKAIFLEFDIAGQLFNSSSGRQIR